jgi:uncharacterized BrkB/YihY/UPF0761 family membrane protein
MGLGFHDVVSIWAYPLYYLLSLALAAAVIWWIPQREKVQERLFDLYVGLVTALGIIVSFAMSAGEKLVELVAKPSFKVFSGDTDVVHSFHLLVELLNYIGLIGIVVMVAGAFSLLLKVSPRAHKVMATLSLSLFLFETINVVRTYSLLHNLRLLNIQ